MNDRFSHSKPEPVASARDKIKTLEELSAIAAGAQAKGLKVVLAHGVFDLVHMGHIRHLEAARREGDLLVVTVTADRFVNKGPGRPIFTENMRAEMLAALEYVTYVAINAHPSAESVLDAVRPDVYIKGSDYENPDDDITGKISFERATVERHGGRLVFTKDITFSSSSLINRYLGVYDRPLQDYLDGLRESGIERRITELIDSVAEYRVLMIGDAIIDEYQYVTGLGKPAKEHIIAMLFKDREIFAGGVFAAANHVANFCKSVDIITCLGGQDSHEDLIRRSLKENVQLLPLHRAGGPTTKKTRFVDASYLRKLFEVYFMDDTPLDARLEAEMNELIGDRIASYDVVIVTDFGHGLIGPSTIRLISERARFLAVNAQTNSSNVGYNLVTKYPRADYVCIDAPEAQLATGDRFSDIEVMVAEKLAKNFACDRMIITHGRKGCVAFDRQNGPRRIPAFTKTVVDTVGAGDAFLAVTAPLAAATSDMQLLGFIGNAAGAMKVGIVGHRQSVEKVPLMRYITTLLK